MKTWHCTPKEFEAQDEYMINLHKNIINLQNIHAWKEYKRREQKNSQK
jgi:hypothetical protein